METALNVGDKVWIQVSENVEFEGELLRLPTRFPDGPQVEPMWVVRTATHIAYVPNPLTVFKKIDNG